MAGESADSANGLVVTGGNDRGVGCKYEETGGSGNDREWKRGQVTEEDCGVWTLAPPAESARRLGKGGTWEMRGRLGSLQGVSVCSLERVFNKETISRNVCQVVFTQCYISAMHI